MQPIPIQQKIHFNSGKTFYVPLKTQPIHTSQSNLTQSYVKTEAYCNAIQPSSQKQASQYLTQTQHQKIPLKNFYMHSIPFNFFQTSQSQSYKNIEISENLKTSYRVSESIIPKEPNSLKTQIKFKIFEESRQSASGNKHNNKLNFGNSSYQLNIKGNSCQMPTKQTLASQQLTQRIGKKINSQVIPSISRSKNDIQTLSKRNNSVSPKSDPLPIRTFHRSSDKMKEQNAKQTYIKTKRSSEQKIKLIPTKISFNNFCEKSTVKVKRQIKSNNISISNVQSNNSFSRYFDTKDVLPPLQNRISYQNIEIQKKLGDSQEYVDTPNIFMDFDKVTSPVLNKSQNITSFVHFDSTLFEPRRCQEQTIKESPKQTTKYSMANLIPFSLIIITVILLAIQILS